MTNLSEIEKALRDLHGLDPEWNKLCGQAADAIRDLQRQNDELTDVVSQCRSAAGWGTPDDPMNVHGWSALGDPKEVPGFIRDQFRELQRQIQEREADARRYRWLRDGYSGYASFNDRPVVVLNRVGAIVELDKAIDAAMAGDKTP